MSHIIQSTSSGRRKVFPSDPDIEKVCIENNLTLKADGSKSPHYVIQCRDTGFYIMTDSRDVAVGFAEGIKFLGMINRHKREVHLDEQRSK